MPTAKDPMLKEFQLFRDKPALEVVEEVCDLFTDDCVLEDTGSKEPAIGRAALRDYCRDYLFKAFPDFRVEPREIFEDGLTSIMVLELSGTHSAEFMGVPATGKKVEWLAVAVYRCNEDCTKVKHETLAYDTGIILQQIKEAGVV